MGFVGLTENVVLLFTEQIRICNVLFLILTSVSPSCGFTSTVMKEPEDVTGFLIHHREPGHKEEQPVNQREEISLSWKQKSCTIMLQIP